MTDKILGPYVDRIESTPDMVWPSPEGRLNKLEPKVFTVSFDSNGGSEVASQQVTEGEKATKPADPTKEEATFVDWYSDAEFTTAYDFNTAVTADITLYAKWL